MQLKKNCAKTFQMIVIIMANICENKPSILTFYNQGNVTSTFTQVLYSDTHYCTCT